MRCRAIGARAVLVCLSLVFPAWGETKPTSDSELDRKAAREFDVGVEHFEAGQFEAAARAFLRADLARSDSDTLANALVAAQKSNEHLLVTQVAERALRAHEGDPGLVARARKALAQAAVHLSLLRLSCSPEPCQLFLDGEEVDPGATFAHPGTHRISATRRESGASREITEEKAGNLVAGATYIFDIDLSTTTPRQDALDGTTVEGKKAQSASHGDMTHPARDRGRVIFYGGVGLTSLLAIVTGVSGVSALRASNEVSSEPTRAEVEAAERQIIRTDVLLAVTASAALFTAGWGLFAADFGDRGEVAMGLVLEKGLGLRARGTF